VHEHIERLVQRDQGIGLEEDPEQVDSDQDDEEEE